jgi:riboflavin biosynthesis pyrimidine reductase
VVYEAPGLPGCGLPWGLASGYGGDLGFVAPCVYGNFVASLDGVVALGPEYRSSGSAISQREPADRFVMALLRAMADAVLIGAGTLRATPAHRWIPGHVWPEGAAELGELRRRLGRSAEPELMVVSARGDVPLGHPAIQSGAVVATTTAGARRLDRRLPSSCTVLALGDGPALKMADVIAALSARGHVLVLTEGVPAW